MLSILFGLVTLLCEQFLATRLGTLPSPVIQILITSCQAAIVYGACRWLAGLPSPSFIRDSRILPVGLIATALASLAAMWALFQPGPLMPEDDYYRLAVAQAVAHGGPPMSYDWFLAGAHGHNSWYILTEWLAIKLHFLSFRFIPLPVIYKILLPLGLRLATAYCCFDLFRSLSALRQGSWTIKFSAAEIVAWPTAMLVLMLGPTPFHFGMDNRFQRQSLFALLLMVLAAALIARREVCLKLGGKRSVQFPPLYWLCIPLVAAAKAPYLPVLACAVLAYETLGLIRRTWTKTALPGHMFIAITSLALTRIAMDLGNSTRSIQGYSFSWGQNNGPYYSSYYPAAVAAIQDRDLSVLVGLGILYVPGVFFIFAKLLRSGRFGAFLPWLGTVTVMVVAGVIAGTSVSWATAGNGSQMYWVFAGWDALGIMVAGLLAYGASTSRTGFALIAVACVTHFGIGLTDFAGTRHLSWNVARRIWSQEVCSKLDSFAQAHPGRRYVIAYPSDTRFFGINANCPFPTILNDTGFGEIAQQPEINESRQRNALLTHDALTKTEWCRAIDSTKADGIFIVRFIDQTAAHQLAPDHLFSVSNGISANGDKMGPAVVFGPFERETCPPAATGLGQAG